MAERDKFETEATGLRAELATQTELVEKCMVAMNENADKGEKAEAELAMLKAQPVQEPIERTAWLIEFSQNQQPVWVKSIWHDDGFTNDANEAILFPTKRCAEDVLDRLFSTPRNKTVFRAARKVYRVTEHIFYAAPVQPALLTDEQIEKGAAALVDARIGKGYWPHASAESKAFHKKTVLIIFEAAIKGGAT